MPQLYTANLNAIKDKYCPDTGKWIFANPQFMVWLNSNSNDLKQRSLWINGMPGAGNPLFSLAGSLSKSENWLTCTGKTYLCFSILEYLQNTTQVPGYVVYAFPTYDNTATNTKIAITQSMIYQFCRANPSLIPAVNRAYESEFAGGRISSLNTCEGLLEEFICRAEPVYIVLDGLDECEEGERRQLLDSFHRLLLACPNLHVLVSSRKEADIRH